MATKANKNADPLKTRNGNTRLGPLGWTQLEEALGKEQKAKVRQKIRNRMAWIQRRHPGLVKVQPAEPAAE